MLLERLACLSPEGSQTGGLRRGASGSGPTCQIAHALAFGEGRGEAGVAPGLYIVPASGIGTESARRPPARAAIWRLSAVSGACRRASWCHRCPSFRTSHGCGQAWTTQTHELSTGSHIHEARAVVAHHAKRFARAVPWKASAALGVAPYPHELPIGIAMSGTYERLIALLSEKFCVDPRTISPHSTLEEIGLDSLAAVELFVYVGQQWNLEVDEGAAVPDRTVQEVTYYFDDCAARPHTDAT